MNKPERNSDGRYKTIDYVMKETNLCRSNVIKLATEANALIRIGRAVRINAEKLYTYIDQVYGCW